MLDAYVGEFGFVIIIIKLCVRYLLSIVYLLNYTVMRVYIYIYIIMGRNLECTNNMFLK